MTACTPVGETTHKRTVSDTQSCRKYTHAVWDFNGTILDDVRVGIDVVNTLLARRALPQIDSAERYRSLFRFPIKDYYSDLGFDFSKERYEDIADEWAKLYDENSARAPLREGVTEALSRFRRAGVSLSVLSASEKGMLTSMLGARVILDRFDDIVGLDGFCAHSKTEAAALWAARVRPQRTLMIGDTDHDFFAARAMGADCVLVCGGHQSRQALERCGCPVLENIAQAADYAGV